MMIILVPEITFLNFKKKISQVGSPDKQISTRNMKPERELVFGKRYFDCSFAFHLVTDGKKECYSDMRKSKRSYNQKENNKTNVKTYLPLLVCDFLLASCGRVDQLCGV